MAGTDRIALDYAAAAQAAASWRHYADEVEAFGAIHPSVLHALDTLGDVYLNVVDAMIDQHTSRRDACLRLAHDARDHADKLDAVAATFARQEQTSAAEINAIDV